MKVKTNMTKLHELLAVEQNLRTQAEVTRKDLWAGRIAVVHRIQYKHYPIKF